MRTRGIFVAAVAVWAFALTFSVRALPAPPAPIQQPPAEAPAAAVAAPTNADCLTCHEDDASVRADGTPVVVKPAVFESSIHGSFSCVDCHQDLATAELPHPEKLKKVDCATCHEDAAALMKVSPHAKLGDDGQPVASCASCHGSHDIKPKTDPTSRSHHLNIAATCARCHADENLTAKAGLKRAVTQNFADSIHGTVLAKSGLVVAPTCSSCHGAHDIRPPEDAASRVSLANVATTCGTCHVGIAREFEGGVHATVLKSGGSNAPACQTCHSSHEIRRSDNYGWQLSVINQCGTCHSDRLSTFRDTFHGQVSALGSRSAASCADCHGAHGILPASDPRSPIAPANLVQTCGKCHANASENFVKYDPHADKHDRERNPALYYTSKFMIALLFGTFGFFGLHSVLWFGKEVSLRRDRRRAAAKGKKA